MPTIDSDLQRKALKRELAKSRQVGDFITCDGGPVSLAGRVDAHGGISITPPERSPAELEAERKRKADREWWDRCWKFYT